MSSTPATDPTLSEPGAPSPGVRTTITFLLFLHLFALFVAVASNARPVSQMRRQLRAVPAVEPYLQTLNMDLAYNYHLTYATQFDTDHFFEIETVGSEQAEPTMYVFPDAGFSLRLQRYRNLTRNAAEAVGSDSVEGLLPRAVAQRILREQGIESGNFRLRLRRHLLQTREAVNSPDPAMADPYSDEYYANAYEADLRLFDGELYLTRTAETGETAPVEQPAERQE